jgi:hypothetical protein
VANGSGVAWLAPKLQANWLIMINPTKKIRGKFFVDMVFSGVWFSKD